MNKRITVLSGDYIGPEIVEQGILALEAAARRFGHRFEFCRVDFGGAADRLGGGSLPGGNQKGLRGG